MHFNKLFFELQPRTIMELIQPIGMTKTPIYNAINLLNNQPIGANSLDFYMIDVYAKLIEKHSPVHVIPYGMHCPVLWGHDGPDAKLCHPPKDMLLSTVVMQTVESMLGDSCNSNATGGERSV